MAAFLVSSMEPQLLEKIITKLEWKSYFRLQQTCKQMEEMIRTNKNIKGICIDMNLQFDSEMDSYFIEGNNCSNTDTEAIYGVCWNEFYLEIIDYAEDDDDYDEDQYNIIDFLEKNRISCKKLEFHRRSSKQIELEQFSRMLRVLKPEVLSRDYADDDFYPPFNALFDVKSLKEVEIDVEFKSSQKFLDHIYRLISHFRNVKLCAIFRQWTQEEIFNLVSKILQYLHSQPLPQFKNLEFWLSCMQDIAGLPSTDYLHDLLRNYKTEEEAVPDLTKTEYQIEILDHIFKGHTNVEVSKAVLVLGGLNCSIKRKRLCILRNNTITGSNVTVNIHRM